jgi:hypothetical protein
MEILNLKNMQIKSQEINSNLTEKPTNANSNLTNGSAVLAKASVYGGSSKTVKQRAHKFNAIAISNINSASNSTNIPMPSKSILNGSSSKILNQQQQQHQQKQQIQSQSGNENVKNLNSSKSAKCEVSTPTTKVDKNNNNNTNNHNIKINIVNKYVSSKNTTLVDSKKVNAELDSLATVTATLKIDDEHNNNIKTDINHNNVTTANRMLLKAGDVKNKINQLNQANVASVSPSSKSTSSPINSMNSSGWIRIFCGPDRSEFSCEDPNRMVLVYSNSSTTEIVKEMALPADYTLWVQIGGEKSRRLDDDEQPLVIQEEFLKKIGYNDESRRSRLGIDPDIKYLIRFHIGPTGNPLCKGATKCGNVDLLKGFIFPQWTRRTIAIIGTKLIVYSSNPGLMPEVYDLSSSEIFEHSPVYNRLIIKIVPKINDSTEMDCLSLLKSNECLNNKSSNSNSNLSVCSNGTDRSNVVLFLGFEDSWERDLYSNWLMEVNIETFLNLVLFATMHHIVNSQYFY